MAGWALAGFIGRVRSTHFVSFDCLYQIKHPWAVREVFGVIHACLEAVFIIQVPWLEYQSRPSAASAEYTAGERIKLNTLVPSLAAVAFEPVLWTAVHATFSSASSFHCLRRL